MTILDTVQPIICNSKVAKHPLMRNVILTLLGICQSSLADSTSSDVTLSPTLPPGNHQSCPVDTPWSCSAGAQDNCCYEGNNGLFLQTQFWDYSPATGPETSWTLHGLWSDRCGGGYRQFCNPSWEIDSAEDTLRGLGLDDLVNTMSEFWKNQGNNDNSLWTHEFNKHGTCMSTVGPNCYENSKPNQNVGDFFNRTVGLYQELTTYEWLSEAGITPSEDKTWSVGEFTDALVKHTEGRSVYLGCDRNNAVNEVWYFFSLKGSVANGEFKFTDSVTTSSCTDGFKYLPKGSSGSPGGGSPGGGSPGGGDGGSYKQGHIYVTPEGQSSSQGCLISDGSWFTSGTCATFRFKETVGGTAVSSSRGPCAIQNGKFSCSKNTAESDFEVKGQSLAYGGSTTWTATGTPQSNQRMPVSPGGNGEVTLELTTDASF